MSFLATEKERHRLEPIQHRWTIGRPYLPISWSDCGYVGLKDASVKYLYQDIFKLEFLSVFVEIWPI